MREELLHFLPEPDAPYATKRNAKAWAKVQMQLEQLKAAPPARGFAIASTGGGTSPQIGGTPNYGEG